jgi:hypothetical protein
MSAIRPTKNTGLIVDEFLRYANEHLSTVTGVIYTTSNYPPLGNPGPGIIQWQGYSVQGFKESTVIDEELFQEVEIENARIDEEFIERGIPLDSAEPSGLDFSETSESDGLTFEEGGTAPNDDGSPGAGGMDLDIGFTTPTEDSDGNISEEFESISDDELDKLIANSKLSFTQTPPGAPPVSQDGYNQPPDFDPNKPLPPMPNIVVDPKKLKEKFMIQTTRVIRELEGGYYHPDMKVKNPKKFACMGASGETMFGIDRVAGSPATTNPPAAKQFWALIDSQGARTKWSHLYIPPNPVRDKLVYLAAGVMEPEFNRMLNRTKDNGITEPNLRKMVLSYDSLLFHFIYAAWNGSGWFEGWARIINKAYRKGVTHPEQLTRLMVAKRLDNTGVIGNKSNNGLIAQGGGKISKLFGYA